MARTILPIANGFYTSDSLPVAAQEAMNVFPVIEEGAALAPETVRSAPGVRLVGGNLKPQCVPYACDALEVYFNQVPPSTYLWPMDNDVASDGFIRGEGGTPSMVVPGPQNWSFFENGALVEGNCSSLLADYVSSGDVARLVKSDLGAEGEGTPEHAAVFSPPSEVLSITAIVQPRTDLLSVNSNTPNTINIGTVQVRVAGETKPEITGFPEQTISQTLISALYMYTDYQRDENNQIIPDKYRVAFGVGATQGGGLSVAWGPFFDYDDGPFSVSCEIQYFWEDGIYSFDPDSIFAGNGGVNPYWGCNTYVWVNGQRQLLRLAGTNLGPREDREPADLRSCIVNGWNIGISSSLANGRVLNYWDDPLGGLDNIGVSTAPFSNLISLAVSNTEPSSFHLAFSRNRQGYTPPPECGFDPVCIPYDCAAYGNYLTSADGIVYELQKPETLNGDRLVERDGGASLFYRGTPEQAAGVYPTVEGQLIEGDCFNTRYMSHGNGFGFEFDRALLNDNNLTDVTAWFGATKKHITFVCFPPPNVSGNFEFIVQSGVGSTYDDTTGFGGTPQPNGSVAEFALGLRTFGVSSDPDEYTLFFQNSFIGPILKKSDGPIFLSLELEPFYLPSDYQPLGDMPTEWSLRTPTFSRGGNGQGGAENPTVPIYGIQAAVRLNGEIVGGQAIGTPMPLRNEVGENDQVFRSKYRVISPDPDSYPEFFQGNGFFSQPFLWGLQTLNVLDLILGTGDALGIHLAFNRNVLGYTPPEECSVDPNPSPFFGGPCRGTELLDGIPYFVFGEELIRLNADESTEVVGEGIVGSGPVSLSQNGTQLMIVVPGQTGYIFSTAPDTLQEISDTDFTANGLPLAVVFIDGYFVITTDQKKIIVSAINDGLSYNALDFGSAESSPDAVVTPVVFKNQLFVGGSTTFEAFSNIGGTGFPFQRVNLFLDQGPSGVFTVQKTSNSFIFVGQGEGERPSVWEFVNNTTQRISTLAVDNLLRQLSEDELAEVDSWYYGQGGHFFVGFSLPNTTIVYDLTTQRWHERTSLIVTPGAPSVETASRARYHISAYGKIYCGDNLDARIGEVSREVYDEYGDPLIRRFSTQPFQNNMKPLFVPMLELTVESGVGNTAAPQPTVTMERSRDGGQTFESARERGMGESGNYSRRAIWRRMGRVARYDVYRFTISDPVKFVGMQLTADIQDAAN